MRKIARHWETAFAVVVTSALAAAAALAQGDAPAPPPKPQAVAAGVWLIPGSFLPKRQPDGNTIIFQTGALDYVIMDTGRHRWHRQAILDFVAARKGTIVGIVNSHWHLDHVSGNPDLKRAYPGAKVYASRAIDDALPGFLAKSAAEARPYLDSDKVPPETKEDLRNDFATIDNGQALKPDVPVDKSETVRFGGLSLRLNLARNAATDGDVWVYAPSKRIAAVGDLVTFPAPFLDTACPEGWRRALGEIEKTPFVTLIPGHGAPMTRVEFTTYRRAYGAFIDCAKSARPKRECSNGWIVAVSRFLGEDPVRHAGARGMAEYYVDMLRANGGKSASCKEA